MNDGQPKSLKAGARRMLRLSRRLCDQAVKFAFGLRGGRMIVEPLARVNKIPADHHSNAESKYDK
jgi:hypothetical protein